MSRPYLTVNGYSEKYGIPVSTVKHWVRTGKLDVMKSVRPMLIPDDQPVPRKDPNIHGYRYQWSNNEKDCFRRR